MLSSSSRVYDPHLLVLLADAVDAANALLNAAGVPRQVVVNQRSGGLKVQPLTGGVGADDRAKFARVEELRDGLLREVLPARPVPPLTAATAVRGKTLPKRTEQYLDGMLASIIPLAQHLAARPWRLVTAVEGAEFLVSDSPVTAMAYDLSGGLLKADFVTAPIDRRHALILGPTGRDDQATLNYGPAEAVGINGATFGSAARWVYAHPESANDTFDRAAEEWTRATSP